MPRGEATAQMLSPAGFLPQLALWVISSA